MPNSARTLQRIFGFLLTVSLLSCSNPTKKERVFDAKAGLSKSEIRRSLEKNKFPEVSAGNQDGKTSTIPALSKLIISPPPPVIGGDKLISFSVSDQIPLKDVLIELARVAKIDIDLDPKISGGVIINAKNRPLKEVIDRIATLGNLRYSYKNGVLFFESDTAYIKNYFVDYLIEGKLWTDVESNLSSILNATTTVSDSSSLLEDSSSSSSSNSSFTSNKSAGIISVYATNKQHQAVEKYLSDVEKAASAQVLIEAKMVEVVLNEEYRAGIDWTRAGTNGQGGNTLALSNSGALAPYTGSLTDVFSAQGLKASVSALEKFGTTRTLSSPRIHAINNQKANLDFANKLVYFKVEASQSAASNGATTTAAVVSTTVTSTKQEESIGVTLEITPSINLASNEVTLSIKPKITESTKTVTDPASGNGLVTVKNEVPVVQTRGLETTAKIKSGNIFVIGGLMKENATNEDNNVPILGKIPVIGWFFKSFSRKSEITETVIFVKATIINSASIPSKFDRNFQNKFDSTARPYFN